MAKARQKASFTVDDTIHTLSLAAKPGLPAVVVKHGPATYRMKLKLERESVSVLGEGQKLLQEGKITEDELGNYIDAEKGKLAILHAVQTLIRSWNVTEADGSEADWNDDSFWLDRLNPALADRIMMGLAAKAGLTEAETKN